ncbi:MAG TPA: hypothetical protein PKV09_04720, partial [Syntrophales bacterium]|nr:hypothetical protein [Syntrophales bacterium]
PGTPTLRGFSHVRRPMFRHAPPGVAARGASRRQTMAQQQQAQQQQAQTQQASAQQSAGQQEYLRARGACLEGKGYSVK